MAKQVTATEDWLSHMLAESDEEKAAANQKRAATALAVRVDQRFAKFVRQAEDKDDLAVRLDAVDDAVRDTADQVALEYGDDPVKLYEAAVKRLSYGNPGDGEAGFHDEFGGMGADEPAANEIACPNCGGPGVELGSLGRRAHYRCRNCGTDFSDEQAGQTNRYNITDEDTPERHWGGAKTADGVTMPEPQTYDYKRVDPESVIGDSPAGARGHAFPHEEDADATLGESKDHPREMQSVEQHVEDRRDMQDNNDGPDSIKRKVEQIDAEKTIGDAKGVGGTFPRGDQSAPVTGANPITSKFYLLD